jgi:hypothetical protein
MQNTGELGRDLVLALLDIASGNRNGSASGEDVRQGTVEIWTVGEHTKVPTNAPQV